MRKALRPAASPLGFEVASACVGGDAGGAAPTIRPSSEVGPSGSLWPSGIVEPYRVSSVPAGHPAVGAAGRHAGRGSGRTRHALPARPRVAERA